MTGTGTKTNAKKQNVEWKVAYLQSLLLLPCRIAHARKAAKAHREKEGRTWRRELREKFESWRDDLLTAINEKYARKRHYFVSLFEKEIRKSKATELKRKATPTEQKEEVNRLDEASLAKIFVEECEAIFDREFKRRTEASTNSAADSEAAKESERADGSDEEVNDGEASGLDAQGDSDVEDDKEEALLKTGVNIEDDVWKFLSNAKTYKNIRQSCISSAKNSGLVKEISNEVLGRILGAKPITEGTSDWLGYLKEIIENRLSAEQHSLTILEPILKKMRGAPARKEGKAKEKDDVSDAESFDSAAFSDEENDAEASENEGGENDDKPDAKAAPRVYKASRTADGAIFVGSLQGEVEDQHTVPIKKNRRGQRERRKIAEKKYGAKAKHIQRGELSAEEMLTLHRLKRKGAPVNEEAVLKKIRKGKKNTEEDNENKNAPKSKNGARPSSQNVVGHKKSGAKAAPVKTASSVAAPKSEDPASLHPSWAAKKKEKEQAAAIQNFQGKKVVFDDDD